MKTWLASGVAALVFLAVSCGESRPTPPTDGEVRTAVEDFGKKLGQRCELIQVSQLGNFNSEQKYWPIRIKYKRFYPDNYIIGRGMFQEVEEDWKLSKEDFGVYRRLMK
jgi:hypothetical protein